MMVGCVVTEGFAFFIKNVRLLNDKLLETQIFFIWLPNLVHFSSFSTFQAINKCFVSNQQNVDAKTPTE